MDGQIYTGSRRFSDLQWYYAKTGITAHFICYAPRKIDRQAFRELVLRVTGRAPHLLMEESLSAEALRHLNGVDIDSLIEHERSERLEIPLSAVRATLLPSFSDTGAPAFRARCWSADEPDDNGNRSVFVMESAHSVMEGIDVSDILRGKEADHHRPPDHPFRQNLWTRAAIAAAAPLLIPFHFVMAMRETRHPSQFGYRSIHLPRGSVTEVARTNGISQRALLFALVLASLEKSSRSKSLYFAFTHHPARRQKNLDDDYISNRTQEMRVKGSSDIVEMARRIDAASKATSGKADATQALIRRLLAMHRALHRRVPWLYPTRFFGYMPYDIVLSMAPPAHPIAERALMKDSVNFAGSFTGTGQNCIFVISNDAITMNFWADPDILNRTSLLLDAAGKLGIEATLW